MHVGPQVEARELGRRHRVDPRTAQTALAQPSLDRRGDALPGNGGGALAGDDDAACRSVPQAARDRLRQRPLAEGDPQAPGRVLAQLAAQRVAHGTRRLADLLEQKVGVLAPVDVAGRDLGTVDLFGRHRQRRTRGGVPFDALQLPGASRVEHCDLAPTGACALRFRLAVEAQIRRGFLDEAVGFACDDEGLIGQSHVEALAAALDRHVEP